MKRQVNECGEHAGPLWLCVSLISSWWEAVWGRDGTYYCYGTLRTPCEALLGCPLCGQQYSRYKHSKQPLKGNHYPNRKNTAHSQRGSLVLYVIKLKEWDICNFSCATYFFSSSTPFPPTHQQHLLLPPPARIFYSLSSKCSFLYVLHSHPSFTISVSSSVRCFLSGRLCEELGRRATWRALSCESARVERNEGTDSPRFRERGRQGVVAKS